MAWTAPRTWTDGELVTAAIMNPHIRDNLLVAGPHLIARKTADETVASSTTLQDDNHLLLTVAANEVWQVEYQLRVIALTAAVGIKLAWTFPTSGEVNMGTTYEDTTNIASSFTVHATTSPSGVMALGVANVSSDVNPITINGFYVGGGTAGTLTLQWAQNTSNATATTLKANSTLWAVKLA